MNPLLVTFAILFVALGQSYAIKSKDNGIEILLAQVKDGISKIVLSSSSKTDKEKIQLLRKTGIAQIINLKGTSNSRVKFSRSGNETYLPVVQMHGMGDWAKDPFGMVPLAKSISEYLGGVYVLNVQIGENSIADILNGFIMNLDDQVDYFANVVKNDPNLANGFNAVGYSQGNLLIRGYIERYNNPPVKNFISMHGPLAGVGAFPGCTLDHNFCRALSEVLGALAYHPTVQDHLAQANYFRDPFRSDDFKAGAIFLPDINNEDTSVNQVYNTNWLSLESICLVKATGDTVVIPNDSEWFGFFQENSFDDIWSFKETPWYQGDLFGLQSLDKAGKVFFDTTSENHLDFDTDYLLNLVGTYFT